jgi:FkbM family methyltransferase
VKDLNNYWGVYPTGILHVGAHKAEEYESYSSEAWGQKNGTIWVEVQPLLASELKVRFSGTNQKVIEAAVWGTSGEELTLKMSSNSQSSSVLSLGTHAETYPDVVVTQEVNIITKRLDLLLDTSDGFDFVNLDIQGAELQALIGLGTRIEKVKWIYTEVNKREVYKGCALIGQIDAFLLTKGFKRVATRWEGNAGWGDSLYIQKSEPPKRPLLITKRIIFQMRSVLTFSAKKARNVLKRFPLG